MRRMSDAVTEIQRLYPQIYLACHVDHVRAATTKWRLSSRDSSILSHLDIDRSTSPHHLAGHLGVRPSTLSATLARLERLGYISNVAAEADRRRREVRLTERGADAMASTSVLDRDRVTRAMSLLTERERNAAVRGLTLLARASRQLVDREGESR